MSAPAPVDAPAAPDLLAASILAAVALVRADLAAQAPQLGRIAGQAGAAFGRHEREWLALAAPDVAGWFPDDRADGRARLFLSGLGAHLNASAATALDAGMQMQLARGWHPDVAWQRALAGYGLDERAMRGYVGAAMTASAQAGAVVADPVRSRVQRALCQYAQRCAADAARAARRSTARVLRRVEAAPPVAGLAVRARDTGRLLMLQRALDPADPAGGTWEFPGGHAEPGETPGGAAVREWQEEVGRRLPRVTPTGSWRHGPYVGIVADVDREADIPIHRGRGSVVNPDDPDGDAIEQLAWWDVEQLARNPAVRAELRASLAKVRAALGEIAKYDPDQPREPSGEPDGGRWAARPHARVKEKEKAAPDAVDALLSGPVADEQPAKRAYQQRAYQQRSYRQYRTYQPERTYAAPRNYRPERAYGGERVYKEPPRRTVMHHLVVLLGKKTVQRPEPVDDDLSVPLSQGHHLYLPLSDMSDYFGDRDVGGYGMLGVNFSYIRNMREAGGDDKPIETRESRSPWSVVEDDPGVEPHRWDALVHDAIELAGIVDSDPIKWADKLSDTEIDQVAERAGYPPGDHRLFRQLIKEAVQRREDGDDDLDPSLISALVDHYVWVDPYKLGTDGKAFARNAAYVMHSDDFGDFGVATVFQLNGLAPDEDLGDMHGRYNVHHIEYQSGLLSGARMPPGVFGVEVVELIPARKD